jgi:hypothetical protein
MRIPGVIFVLSARRLAPPRLTQTAGLTLRAALRWLIHRQIWLGGRAWPWNSGQLFAHFGQLVPPVPKLLAIQALDICASGSIGTEAGASDAACLEADGNASAPCPNGFASVEDVIPDDDGHYELEFDAGDKPTRIGVTLVL